jgi:diguanylate cyclase (GGDEF)-like protein/PAS domain S-box-containing protein
MDRESVGKQWPDDRVNQFLDQISEAGEDYRRLVERLPAIVYACEVGESGQWRYVSPQIEEILGYTPEEWVADPELWAAQLHPDDRERALAQEEEQAAANSRNGRPIDYRMITRYGDVVWLLDEAVLEPDHDGVPVWHGVLYDITERKIAEEDLRRAVAQQATVAQLSSHALQHGESDALMDEAVQLMVEIDGIDSSCIWEVGRDGRRLRMLSGAEIQGTDGSRRASAAHNSHAGAALESGLHVIVDDWEAERRFSMPPALRALGVRSSLAVPIDGRESPFGVLDIHSLEPNSYTPQDVHFAQASANVLADAVERHATDRALRHRVLHDSLTGLPNRTSFVQSLEIALQRGAVAGTPVGVLFLDLDSFKLVNDSIGHHGGDELLRAIAPRMRAHLRPGDIVARFGGDEFGILIDRLADEDEAIAIATRVSAAFAEPYAMGGVEHFVSASIGIAVGRPTRNEPIGAESLIRDADAAMYRAKERGRARCELFDAEMRARAARRLEVERDLRDALANDELQLHYQPLVDLRSGEIISLEALLRWEHPRRGVLEPEEFISVAEECGLIGPIGRWVEETACRQAVEWQGLRPDRRPLDVSVNISARQVAHRELADSVGDVLARTGLDPIHLQLEVTETILVDESAMATTTLEALGELGVRLVLDDFGTGYSSLAYLSRFPFDALKIDRSFIEGLGVEQERTAIVEAIIGMARALSLDAIAVGVESDIQLAELRRIGCDYGQGHLFSRPLPAADITRLIRDGELELLGNSAR